MHPESKFWEASLDRFSEPIAGRSPAFSGFLHLDHQLGKLDEGREARRFLNFGVGVCGRFRKVAEGCGRLRKVAEGCGMLRKVAESCGKLGSQVMNEACS